MDFTLNQRNTAYANHDCDTEYILQAHACNSCKQLRIHLESQMAHHSRCLCILNSKFMYEQHKFGPCASVRHFPSALQ